MYDSAGVVVREGLRLIKLRSERDLRFLRDREGDTLADISDIAFSVWKRQSTGGQMTGR